MEGSKPKGARLRTLVVFACAATVGCQRDAADREPPAMSAATPGTSPTGPSSPVLATDDPPLRLRCDRRGSQSTCLDWPLPPALAGEAGWVRRACEEQGGSFASAPCDRTNLAYDCALGDMLRLLYYSDGPNRYAEADARWLCVANGGRVEGGAAPPARGDRSRFTCDLRAVDGTCLEAASALPSEAEVTARSMCRLGGGSAGPSPCPRDDRVHECAAPGQISYYYGAGHRAWTGARARVACDWSRVPPLAHRR